MNHPIKAPRKLIEVALPLDEINLESLRRKQKAPKGWPTSFHKWWAQRPLAAARGVLFGQLVNDPSWKWEIENPGAIPPNHLKASWAKSRKRLFELIGELVLWDNSNNRDVLEKARTEIRKSWREVCELNAEHPQAKLLFDPEKLPIIHDPFAGSGTIPLEGQRLGLGVIATDLNPVAVVINKALLELPFLFRGRPPISRKLKRDRESSTKLSLSWTGTGAQGMAEDVRYYAKWMHTEAVKRIGHLYAPIKVTPEMTVGRPDLAALKGEQLNVVAWIWARTVCSPNPAFSHVPVPLTTTFILSSKEGQEAYVHPVLEGDQYRFIVKMGTPPTSAVTGTAAGKRAAYTCLLSDVPIDYNYIRNEGKAGRMGQRLMAVVAEGARKRVYLDPTPALERTALEVEVAWRPDLAQPANPRDFKTPNYGLATFGDIFTARQLTALTTFSDLVNEAREQIKEDAIEAGLPDDGRGLESGSDGATAYGEALAVYLACIVDRMVYYGSSLTTWLPKDNALRDCMPRQALAMTWDFAECNPLGKSSGDVMTCANAVCNYLDVATPFAKAIVNQLDAGAIANNGTKFLFSTDPPYYDNIGYADLSDYFYVWLRRNLRQIYPTLFSTIAAPKAQELVATPYRHGGKENAEEFFLDGMTRAMQSLSETCHPAMPVTIYYAFKQAETVDEEGTSSTGWQTFLGAVLRAGFVITGTLPMRTEGAGRMMAKGNNALASSIVLVCRKREPEAPTTSRRAFQRELNAILPQSLDEMTKGIGDEASPVAPVDLSQAIIGPGMAVFSKYSAVLEADGSPMSVRTALQLINRFLAEDDFDADTQFCLHWFEQHEWSEGLYGQADVLARAKATSVNGLAEAGVVQSGGGSVRLRKWAEYPPDWDPKADTRLPVWESLHQLIRALKSDGETGAGRLLSEVKAQSESIRQLAYRLYTLCERKGWAEDARAYNELITSWTGIESVAGEVLTTTDQQLNLFGESQ